MKTYANALIGYYQTNKETISKRIHINRKVNKRHLSSSLNVWFQKAEGAINKVRIMKYICALATKAQVRSSFKRIFRYALSGQSIADLGEQKYD